MLAMDSLAILLRIPMDVDAVTTEDMEEVSKQLPRLEAKDKVIGTIETPALRRMWTLATKKKNEALLGAFSLSLQGGFSEAERKEEMVKFEERLAYAKLLRSMFFFSLHDEMGNFGLGLSLKQDWTVVELPDKGEADIIRGLLGGLFGDGGGPGSVQ